MLYNYFLPLHVTTSTGDWEGEGEGVAQSSHDPTVSTTATRQEVPTNTQERTTITTEPFGDWDSANSLS